MSSYRDNSAYSKPSQVTPVSKGLAASRWALGSVVDQQTNNLKAPTNKAPKVMTKSLATSRWASGPINQKMEDQQMTDVEMPTVKTIKTTTNGLLNSRWATDSAKPNQTGGNSNATKGQQKNHLSSTLMQPSYSHDRKTPPTPDKINLTTRRIIGPLSEEEKTVKMENPFFDPEKHKGLSSSRWAD